MPQIPPPAIFLLLIFSCARTPVWGQGGPVSDTDDHSCFNAKIVSVPSRPTITDSTDTTQCGVVEVEFGLERQWPGAGANHDDLSGGLRLGLTHSMDMTWSSGTFVHIMDGDGDRTGFGDNWLGLRYRFIRQKKRRPSFGLFYEAKIPSANAGLGLGSGAVDHSLSFLISKDLHQLHIDFNVIQLLDGRRAMPGFDHGTGLALAPSLPITRHLTVVAEPYGYTALNASNPAFASVMGGITYQVKSRLFLDGGLDGGLTRYAPHKRVFVGVTYAIANFYSWFKSP